MHLNVAIQIRNGSAGQDRAGSFPARFGQVLALADGAGGFGDGAVAADLAIATAMSLASDPDMSLSMAMDQLEVAAAEAGSLTTFVLVRTCDERFEGISAGDSIAWLILPGRVVDLTEYQRKKPLVGSGAIPMSFEGLLSGRLLLASDGLHKYAPHQDIVRAARSGTVAEAAQAIAELPRLPSGKFMDDVGVLIAELAR